MNLDNLILSLTSIKEQANIYLNEINQNKYEQTSLKLFIDKIMELKKLSIDYFLYENYPYRYLRSTH